MVSKHNPQKIQQFTRPGEGVEIQVVTRSEPQGPDGLVTFGLDFSKAAVPDRRYVADTAGMVIQRDKARLWFAQSTLTGNGTLRSLLDVQMSTDNLKNVTDTMSPFKAKRDDGKLQFAKLTDLSVEPDQTVGLAATSLAASAAGNEGCVDFYYMSPFAIGHLERSGKLYAEPVVRVSLPTPLLNSLIEAMIQAANTLSQGGSK